MSIVLNDNIKVNAGKPSDYKYLNDLNKPYSGTSEVFSKLPAPLRYTGLTVNINTSEYWFKDGIADLDLVLKQSEGTGSGERIEKTFTQASHGFSIGDILEYSGSTFILALAVTERDSEIMGFVSEVPDVDSFTVVFSGYVSGISGLTLSANTTYYLSPTIAGALTNIQPEDLDTISKPILTTLTNNDALIFNYVGVINSTGLTGGGTVTNAGNGLTLTGDTIVLGGILDSDVYIEGNSGGTSIFNIGDPDLLGLFKVKSETIEFIDGGGDTIFNGGSSGTYLSSITGIYTLVSGLYVSNGFLSSNGEYGFEISSGSTGGSIPKFRVPEIGTGFTINLGNDNTGDIYYRNDNGHFTRLPIGTTNQQLIVSGSTPIWSTPVIGAIGSFSILGSGSYMILDDLAGAGGYVEFLYDSTGTAEGKLEINSGRLVGEKGDILINSYSGGYNNINVHNTSNTDYSSINFSYGVFQQRVNSDDGFGGALYDLVVQDTLSTDNGSIYIDAAGSFVLSSLLSGYSKSISFNFNNGINVQSDSLLFSGLNYDTDYSANFTEYSIPHVGWITGYTSSLAHTNGNGITASGTSVNLGGQLIQDTTISGMTGYRLDLGTSDSWLSGFGVDVYNGIIDFNSDNIVLNSSGLTVSVSEKFIFALESLNLLKITNTGTTFIDAYNGAIKYGDDYSSTYTARSIPDAGWVTGITSMISGGSGFGSTILTSTVNIEGSEIVNFGTVGVNPLVEFNVTTNNSGGTGTISLGSFGSGSSFARFYATADDTVGINYSDGTSLSGEISVSAAGASLGFSDFVTIESTSINLTSTSIIVNGSSGFTGAIYNADYSANYIPRSIPDVGWVTSMVAMVTGGTGLISQSLTEDTIINGLNTYYLDFNNLTLLNIQADGAIGITSDAAFDMSAPQIIIGVGGDYGGAGDVLSSDGAGNVVWLPASGTTLNVEITNTSFTATTSTNFVGVSGTTSIVYLPSSPSTSQMIYIKDIDGDALSNNITINGNTNLIDGETTALINTNYGSITLFWYGSGWSIIASI